MIIVVLGGIGSGKTLSIVKEIVDNKQYAFTNFKLSKRVKHHRIKISDIVHKAEKMKDYRVNWEFWEKARTKNNNFCIYLDEIHNVIHSRKSMSKMNVLMSKWISQIRKILSDSPRNHIYLISQTLRKIDVDFRELAQIYIVCQSVQHGKSVYIKQKWYDGLQRLEMGRKPITRTFLGNKYFKYYDSHELVTFEDAEEYI